MGSKLELLDLTGRKYGKLTVLGIFRRADSSKSTWLCKCDCGNEKIVRGRNLRGGGCKSCGCAVKFKGLPGETGFKLILSIYKKGAKKRNLEFSLTDEEFKALVTKNCYYCGSKPTRKIKPRSEYSSFICNGVDRRDNLEGYTQENSVPCCGKCNIMKNIHRESDFLNHCSLIAEHNS